MFVVRKLRVLRVFVRELFVVICMGWLCVFLNLSMRFWLVISVLFMLVLM